MSDKKGVELSLNMMILVVLVLLVLFIAVFMLVKANNNANTANSCEAHNGQCYALTSPCPTNIPIAAAFNCPKDSPKCCANIGGFGDATN